MKKYLLLLTVLVLLCCGCTNQQETPTDPVLPPETLPVEYYTADSTFELETGGAVLRYDLPDNYRDVKLLAGRLLIVTEAGLELLEGDKGTVVAALTLSAEKIATLQVMDNGLTYYDAENKSVQFLDTKLQITKQIPVTDDVTNPLIAPDGSAIYYCVNNEIRVFETERRISRMLKSHTCVSQELLEFQFDGKLLVCRVEETVGIFKTVYISTENGKTLSSNANLCQLSSFGDKYLAVRMDGTVLQRIVGTLNAEAKQLQVSDAYVASALALDSIVGYSVDGKETVQLNLYNASSGQRTGEVTLNQVGQPQVFLTDKENNFIWMLATTADGSANLIRWDVSDAQQGETVYLSKLYTAEDPDESGLKDLQSRASKLNSKYGVRIRIWQDAVKVTGEHQLSAEHQISAISAVLDDLEAVFKEFPKRFIYKSISSRVRICIVRSVDGEAAATQFWSGKYAFIVLSPGVDVRSEFIKGFGFVVDSHVLGNSPVYDYWNDLNPEGFVYGGAADGALATGENRAFVDVDSMTSGTIDRSRIFWQAMQPNNAEMFKSEIMQNKLNMLCKAIRDAWRLEKETEVYVWEQYLLEPVAAKKK